jgi:sulfite reductase (NADPH) hemoprotein beta-component
LEDLQDLFESTPGFKFWVEKNTQSHKVPGYINVVLSIKTTGLAPGDLSANDFTKVADIADKFALGQVRVTHHQNIVVPDIAISKLHDLWVQLKEDGFATANINTLNDITCCPGGDYCSLANAKSIPIAEQIQRHFDNMDDLYDLGDIELNISGCMNACGHHHIGHIGILGVDKKGEEFYQVSLGGQSKEGPAIGKIVGPSFKEDEIVGVMDTIIKHFVNNRQEKADKQLETFNETVARIGVPSFKEVLYPAKDK